VNLRLPGYASVGQLSALIRDREVASMPNTLFIAVARLITKFSPSQEGILRLYVHYKRSQRANAQIDHQAQALAHVIQNELQLVVKDENILKALATSMQVQIQNCRHNEEYFGELASWIVALRRTQPQYSTEQYT
jgi:hypothetical protein